MVKILMILGGLGKEGITNSVLTYLENLDIADLDMTLGIAGKAEEKALDRAKKLDIKIVFLPGRNVEPIKYFSALKDLVKKEKYDIVHVHGNSATLGIDMLAAKMGGASVRIAHSHNTSCSHIYLDKLLRPLFYSTYTQGAACGVDAGKWLFPNREFVVIPNGKYIPTFLFDEEKRAKIRNELDIDDKIILGHVGMFNLQKNHRFLIEVFKELCKKSNKYALCLFGSDGGTQDEIEALVKKYAIEDKVLFMGYKDNVADYLSAMDIMLLPSLYEGLPTVVIEWQISGLPTSISDTITSECMIMENVKRLSITSGVKEWVDEIVHIEPENRCTKKDIIINVMRENGYDIKYDAERLKNMYMELMERKK